MTDISNSKLNNLNSSSPTTSRTLQEYPFPSPVPHSNISHFEYNPSSPFPTILSTINDDSIIRPINKSASTGSLLINSTVPTGNSDENHVRKTQTTTDANNTHHHYQQIEETDNNVLTNTNPPTSITNLQPLSVDDVLQIIHEASSHNLLISAKSATGKPLKGAAKSKAQTKAITSILYAVESGYFVQAFLAGEGRPNTPSSPNSNPPSTPSNNYNNDINTTIDNVTLPITTNTLLGFAPGITLTKLAYNAFWLALTESLSVALQSLQTAIQQLLQSKYLEELEEEQQQQYHHHQQQQSLGGNHNSMTNNNINHQHHPYDHYSNNNKRSGSMNIHNTTHNKKRKVSMDIHNHYDIHDNVGDDYPSSIHNKHHHSTSPNLTSTSPNLKGMNPSLFPTSPVHTSLNSTNNLNSSVSSTPYHNYQYRSLPFPSSWLSSTLLKQQRRQHSNSITSNTTTTSNDDTYPLVDSSTSTIDGTPLSSSRNINPNRFESIVTPTNKPRLNNLHMERTPPSSIDITNSTTTNSTAHDGPELTSNQFLLPSPNRLPFTPTNNHNKEKSLLSFSSPRKYSFTNEKYRYTDSQYYRQLLELLSTTVNEEDTDYFNNMDDYRTILDQHGYYHSTVKTLHSPNTTVPIVGVPHTPTSTSSDSVSLSTEITVSLFPNAEDNNIRLPLTFGAYGRPVPRYSLLAINDTNITNPLYYTAYRLKYGYFLFDGYINQLTINNNKNTLNKNNTKDNNNSIQQWVLMRDTIHTNNEGYDMYIWGEYKVSNLSLNPSQSPIIPILTNIDWTDFQWSNTGLTINHHSSYRLIGIQYVPL